MATLDDGEIVLDVAVSVDALLELSEHALSLDQLAEGSRVSVVPGSGVERHAKFVARAVLSLAHVCEHTTSHVAHVVVAIGVVSAVRSVVLFVSAASEEAKAGNALSDVGADVGLTLGVTFEHRGEVVDGGGLAVLVQLEDEVTYLVATAGNGQVNSGVGWVGVFVQAAEGLLSE